MTISRCVMFFGVALSVAGCNRTAPAASPACDCTANATDAGRPTATTGALPSTPGPVAVDFQNVHLHVADGVVMEVLDPRRMPPAPRIEGKVTSVRVEGDRIVQIFGKPPAGRPRGETGNYMYYRGNMLRFGRLTMRDTDMRLVDADPRDSFDFSPTEYVKQLVAGYSKNSPDGSLRVFMPDYDDVTRKK